MNKVRSVIRLAALAAVMLSSAAAAEEQEQEQAQQERELPTFEDTVVFTASKKDEDLKNAPATMTVITAETIENSPAQNVPDLLRMVPGLNIVQTSARDFNLTSRAATSTLSHSQLVLLDGRSIYQDFFGIVLWDFLPVNTGEIKQIEVIRGPASAVWGANAMTGVVNVITKTPREMEGTTLTTAFGHFDRSVAEQDLGGLFSVDATHAQAVSDSLAFKVSAGMLTQEAFQRPTGTIPGKETPYPTFENQGTTQHKFDMRVDYDFPDGRQKLIVAGGFAGTDGIIHTGVGPLNIERGSILAYGRLNYQRDNLKLKFFVNALDADAPALLAVEDAPALALKVGGEGLPFSFENQTYDIEFSNWHLLGTKHLVSYGGNYRHNSFDLSLASRGDNRDEGGAYVQADIVLSDHVRWVVGTRVDQFDVLNKAVLSPRTAFIVTPRPDHTFRVSFNRAFRAPSFVNSFLDAVLLNQLDLGVIDPLLAGQTFGFSANTDGNEQLTEEALTAYEVAYLGVFGRATVNAAFYVNHTEDMIVFTQTGTYSSSNQPPGWPLPPNVLDVLNAAGKGLPSQFTYLNLEKVRDKGVELSLDTRVNDNINAFANYSWQDDPEPEGFDMSELNRPPTHRFNTGFNFSRGRYFGNLSMSFIDDAFWEDVLDARFNGSTESYTLVNGGIGVRSADGTMTVAVKATNLFNEAVQQHVFGDIIKRSVTGEIRFSF